MALSDQISALIFALIVIAVIVYANLNDPPVDMWTTRRGVAHRDHRHSNSRPERNEKCVTHVVGQNCYPCPRLLNSQRRFLIAHNSARA